MVIIRTTRVKCSSVSHHPVASPLSVLAPSYETPWVLVEVEPKAILYRGSQDREGEGDRVMRHTAGKMIDETIITGR